MPLCLFAYGIEGLSIATAITSIILVLHFSLNILLSSRTFSIKPLLNCYPIYALIFSLIFVYFRIPAPKFLENTTFLIGYSTIFLVLMSLGIALSKLKVFSFKECLTYSLIRVLIGPIIGLFFVKFFNLTGVEAGVMFIQAAMPSAILTYLVGSMYSKKRAVDNVASVIVSSTLLSFITIPIVVWENINSALLHAGMLEKCIGMISNMRWRKMVVRNEFYIITMLAYIRIGRVHFQKSCHW